MKVILTGATGAAGLATLRALLSDSAVTHVTVLGRRRLPSWIVLPGGSASDISSPTHPKLTSITHEDFKHYPAELQTTIAGHDACVWALGTSSLGMSEAAYADVTVGFLDTFLDILKAYSVGSPEHPFRVVFVSGQNADREQKDKVMFRRVKGRAEQSLVNFARRSEGGIKATILRPGFFSPSTAYPQDAPNQRSAGFRVLDKYLFTPTFRAFFPHRVITTDEIARFSVEALKGRWDSQGDTFENEQMKDALKAAP
ncbi:hypothetical protein BC834DRAFT_335419 [Gloeopeniophorella convolvens]|nr:hypothetical protein BC834DRAFT_335419 [Gloeopeniophorella convolvens]